MDALAVYKEITLKEKNDLAKSEMKNERKNDMKKDSQEKKKSK